MLALPPHLVIGACLLAALASSPRLHAGDGEPRPVPQITWEDFVGTAADGSPLPGKLGRLRVPESRAHPDGATIELAFVRFVSDNSDKGPPIVYLEGGPGGSGIEGCQWAATVPLVDLLAYGDVIGLDQRGTGLSRPSLVDGPEFGFELPLDRPVTRESIVAASRTAAARCVAHWREQDVDLAAYTTQESADDVDDLRRALGLEQIVTYGTSYGSHLSLAYLRRHGEHVARAYMAKVEGPDQTYKLPSTIQHHLERLHELAAADAGIAAELPDMLGSLREVLARLREHTVDVTFETEEGQTLTIALGPYDVQWALSMRLGRTREVVQVPDLVHRMAGGDFSSLGEDALMLRRDSGMTALLLAMDCASGASPARLARIAREAADPANLLGDAINVPFPDVCAECGDPDLGDDFRGPLACDVPVLFSSGDLDARTPPENVDEILPGFTHATHVLVEGTGHDGREVISPEFRALFAAFMRGEPVQGRTITLPGFQLMPLGFQMPAGR